MRASKLLAAALLAAAPLAAQPTEPGITRDQADAILGELRQIRQLMEKAMRAAAAPTGEAEQKAQMKIGPGPILGNKNAPVTMVEFTDYQCTFCQRFHVTTFPEIRKKYIETGKVRFISRDFPLDFHANAANAAEAARCAGDQNQFWEMRDRLVANPSKLSETDLAAHAGAIRLDSAEFRKCLDSGKHRSAVQQDMAEAARLGIQGTPSFVIGRSTPDGVDGVIVVGARPLTVFEEKFKEFGK
jgi:protein-disulfide isomerase